MLRLTSCHSWMTPIPPPIEYFVQPPGRFRAELQRKGDATKQIHILQDGMGQWTKYPDGKVERLKLFN
jgi:hypothetical protein